MVQMPENTNVPQTHSLEIPRWVTRQVYFAVLCGTKGTYLVTWKSHSAPKTSSVWLASLITTPFFSRSTSITGGWNWLTWHRRVLFLLNTPNVRLYTWMTGGAIKKQKLHHYKTDWSIFKDKSICSNRWLFQSLGWLSILYYHITHGSVFYLGEKHPKWILTHAESTETTWCILTRIVRNNFEQIYLQFLVTVNSNRHKTTSTVAQTFVFVIVNSLDQWFDFKLNE